MMPGWNASSTTTRSSVPSSSSARNGPCSANRPRRRPHGELRPTSAPGTDCRTGAPLLAKLTTRELDGDVEVARVPGVLLQDVEADPGQRGWIDVEATTRSADVVESPLGEHG